MLRCCPLDPMPILSSAADRWPEVFLPAHDVLNGPADMVHVIGLVDDGHDSHFPQPLGQSRILQHGQHDQLDAARKLPPEIITEQRHTVTVRAAGHGEVGDQNVAGRLLQGLDELGGLTRLPPTSTSGNLLSACVAPNKITGWSSAMVTFIRWLIYSPCFPVRLDALRINVKLLIV